MKKSIIFSFLAISLGYFFFSCGKSFLDNQPNGTLNQEVLSNQKGVEALLIGAYSMLDGYQNTMVSEVGNLLLIIGYMAVFAAVMHIKEVTPLTSQI